MNKFYLSNEKKDFLRNDNNNLFEFKNINHYIFSFLPIFNKKKNNIEKKKILKIDSSFDSLFEYKNDYLNIKNTNINFSLEIFSDIFFINNFFYIINYYNNNKKIDLVFNNYSSYNLIEQYKKILDELYKERNITNFNFNINSIKDLDIQNNKYKIIDILKNKIEKNYYESKKNIFDLYLKDYKNVPESSDNIYNYISFLRKFPIFNKLILKYFEEKNINYYEKLNYIENLNNFQDENNFIDENNDEIIINEPNNTIFNTFLNFFVIDNKIINIKFLLYDNINSENDFLLNNYNFFYDINFFKVKEIDNVKSNDVLNIYKNMINKKKSSKYIKNKIFRLFLNINNFSLLQDYFNNIDNINKSEIYKEQINIIINKFVFLLFFIYEYYNLKQYKTLDELSQIFYNNFELEENTEGSVDDKIKLDLYLYYIYTSYMIFNNDFFYSFYKKIIFYLQHFFYIFNYFKNNNDKLFPIYIFLLFSEENLKVIKEYNSNENNILSFLENLYDNFYPNKTKIILS